MSGYKTATKTKITRLNRPEMHEAWRKAGFAGMDNKLREISRKLGEKGERQAGAGQLCNIIETVKACPWYNTPVHDQVRITMNGPQTEASIGVNFGDTIDLFNTMKGAVGIDSYESTFGGQPGEPQTPVLVMGHFFHMETDPWNFSTICNALTIPETGITQPASPNTFAPYDLALATTLGLASGATLKQAFLDWGNWIGYAMWHMSRAYNLTWNLGNHNTIINDVLRMRSYLVQSAQDGSASSSQVSVLQFFNRVNERYRSLGAAFIALMVDRVRYGFTNTPAVGAGPQSLFRIDRAFETVDLTFGGTGIRRLTDALKGNAEINKLSIPMIWKAGVPYGLRLTENDSNQANLFRSYIAIDQFQPGDVPPDFTADSNLTVGATAATNEYSSDSPQAMGTTATFSDRVLFKGGDWKLTQGISGFELPEDLVNQMCSDPAIKALVEETAKCQLAQAS